MLVKSPRTARVNRLQQPQGILSCAALCPTFLVHPVCDRWAPFRPKFSKPNKTKIGPRCTSSLSSNCQSGASAAVLRCDRLIGRTVKERSYPYVVVNAFASRHENLQSSVASCRRYRCVSLHFVAVCVGTMPPLD